ncbi:MULTISPECIES: diaminopimelate decarboxylase [Archaeoglobus]|jgi:diaminopimelate decarboxylase|uniref:Diaminopimelate decarboxylase n=3 Tax=Archaeoglobus fulgidus TaxID=2234 RepID=DCDA_ARCFU|nr:MULTISPECIES: diaminopimelate decarboxylase [Archaeoglobus]O29458.1 RecName: Full=Diaminopimelate decarboxylase; Short=DAP decarboxylase; Short=DAPDC [Archaeoglobus fulgidus DSM 4304]AAB90438.1 diaminopimelate decarboxylase (lysA) [Archaeoglobus fulgidus DSM 4304]AIG97676.1 diaminopimelate decarboxylase [Archaeoglobus fulgidus DSM 8774]KUJ93893.1 MAG: Diaminopimelate decarboxylase [Archaeoglobus fulgidus]KUK07256.1 MAG: Diaminopimelate decarboxylase [Archaeoglobus fulgidus]MDI3497860.1 dia
MFSTSDGILTVEGVKVTEIVRETGTPVYVTSRALLERNLEAYKKAFSNEGLLYAVKANNNLALMRIIASHGFGADVFSDGELYLASLAGFRKDMVLFNGNSKSRKEIEMGVTAGVKFSVDSLDELRTISKIAKEVGKEVEIAFRVNPDVDPKTHPKIATGLRESKFGIPHEMVREAYEMALKLDGVVPVGIHCHIGSQILDLSPFVHALNKVMDIAVDIEKLGVELSFVDMGGGLGIDYEGKGAPTPKDLASAILPEFEGRKADLTSDPQLWLEPGRSIVGNTTVLITRVNAVKKGYKNFVAVDAGFNVLIRPAMYGSYHRVAVANKMDAEPEEVYTVVGPICESGDVLARDRKLPKVEVGDLIAVFDAGAYGFVMSSQYNGRPRCAEVLVSGDRWDVIREKESYGDLIEKQRLPEWLL